MKPTRTRMPSFALSFLLSSTTTLFAGQFGITKIADVTTPYPGGSGSFMTFLAPSLDNNHQALVARNDQGIDGVFSRFGGTFQRLADTTMAIPSGNGNFTSFGGLPSLSEGKIVFSASGADQQEGIYLAQDGLHVIANQATTVPGEGTGITFSDFGSIQINGDTVAFGAQYRLGAETRSGVYRHNQGAISVVADRHTTLPNGESFIVASHPVIDWDQVAFAGLTENRTGLFQSNNSGITTIVDSTMMAPDGVNTFTNSFAQLNMKGDTAAFLAWTSDHQHSLFTKRDGFFQTIAGPSVPIPDGVGEFTSFLDGGIGGIGISGDILAFSAFGENDQHGLYLKTATGLHKIVDRGDLLDGREVLYFLMGRESLDDSQLAFTAVFHDLTSAVYIAQVPEPSSLAMLWVGAALAFRRRRRRISRLP